MNTEKRLTILVAETDDQVQRMLTFALESQLGASVIEARDCEVARQFLNTVSDINLVVIGAIEQFKELVELIKSGDCPPELSCILAVSQKIKDTALLTNPRVFGIADRKAIVDEVPRILREKFLDGEIVNDAPADQFCRIRAQLLLVSPPLSGDIYIRLSETKYLKLFRKGDRIETEDVEKYWKKKNVEFFYVRREESQHFLSRFNAEAEKIIRNAHIEEAAVRALSTDIHDSVHWMVEKVGVTEEVREMTRQNVRLVIKTVGTQPKLGSIFDRINREMGQYIVSHSLAVGEVACVMAANLTFLSDLTFQKLVLAGLFHDITLKNHELARAQSLSDVIAEPKLLLLETLEDYKAHPLRAAELVGELQNTPADVDAIIRQHHERPDATGFPHAIGVQHISPLSSIFIMAHDYVDFAMLSKERVTLSQFFQNHRAKYSMGYFKKIQRALEEREKQEQT